ncbi:MAG: glycosyltransferase family 2 protein [Spirochaetia bacterium]|nr:MAG: glycosyltransferase family 2 protein [Spirochaetia bacterium]
MKRFFEILPGALAWITIILMFLLSWLAPAWTAIFIILFDIYWLLKTVYLSIHLRVSFKKIRENLKVNWLNELANLRECSTNNTNNISEIRGQICDYSRIYHLIILPMYKEQYEVVRESFNALAKTNYSKDKIIVVLAPEERAGEETRETARKIENEFSGKFFKFLTVFHPVDLPGEIPGKGSNQAWAAKEVKKSIIDSLQIPYENILLSVFDVDTQVPLNYFGRLTYVFLTCKNPQRSSFQPVPLFTNNIFQATALARVIAFSSTFWHMIQQSRPERQTTFSSHSMSFKAITEIGFWDKDIVSEDSRIFWQCYLHYGGDWRVEALFYPVSMDANVAPTFWKTMVNQYKQQRRWGWGCENIPYFLKGFGKDSAGKKRIPLGKKLYWTFNILESFHSWATNTLMIFALGWLPIYLGGANFSFTVLSYNLPQVTKFIMTLAMVGVVSSAILSIILLPPKPNWFKKRHYVFYILQWLLMPITLVIFGAIPGLEAQTRMMLGGKFRLGFWVTPKHR